MNKKILALTLVLLAIPMLAMVPVQAKKTIVPFTDVMGFMTTISGTTVEKFSGDGHLKIATGTQREGVYNGPLGTGMFYSEAIISIMENWLIYPAGKGRGVYKMRLEITSGSALINYGTGTLEGIGTVKTEFDMTEDPLRMEFWSKASLKHGTGDLEGVMLNTEGHGFFTGPDTFVVWNSGEIILP